MAITEKPLSQIRLTTTDTTLLYQPSSGVKTQIKPIVIANSTGSSPQVDVYHDIDGTTYDDSSLIYRFTVPANESVTIDFLIADENGAIAVKSNTANAITVTAYGLEHS